VFATKSLLKLGGDECDNFNFMIFKILTVTKLVKIGEFWELLKLIKLVLSFYALT